MIIYIVQVGDTITKIADQFGASEARLIQENGIPNPNELVIGQTIVIAQPQKTYIVEERDTISDIALKHEVPIMQLYRNNPFLWEREYIYPGEELIISYETNATISTNAYVFPFVDRNILRKSLPYLTYLSVLNYKTLREGEIESFYDDSDLIETAKEFGVAPLMLITSVSFQGERNPEIIYEILLNTDYQDNHAKNMLEIMKEKGYYGINITITYLNKTNQELYLSYIKRVTSFLNKEGYQVFITIDPNFVEDDIELLFEKVDFSYYNELIDEAYVMRFNWGTQYGPPMPVSSIENITIYVNYLIQMIDPKKVNVGFPLLGYDWTLPYIQGYTVGNAITIDSAIELARLMGATIVFDDVSQSPYFEYSIKVSERTTIQHIVWFVDARTIYSVINLMLENELQRTGLWNIMSYFPQLWLIIRSNCNIKKILPELIF